MKISIKVTSVILFSPLLAACGGNFYSQSGSSGASRCETLANNYWSEYQAYKDADDMKWKKALGKKALDPVNLNEKTIDYYLSKKN